MNCVQTALNSGLLICFFVVWDIPWHELFEQRIFCFCFSTEFKMAVILKGIEWIDSKSILCNLYGYGSFCQNGHIVNQSVPLFTWSSSFKFSDASGFVVIFECACCCVEKEVMGENKNGKVYINELVLIVKTLLYFYIFNRLHHYYMSSSQNLNKQERGQTCWIEFNFIS